MWSLLLKDGMEYTPTTRVQPFTQEEWDRYPFADEEKLQWFRDAKLGLFLHVGLAALGKVDISWSRHTHKLPDPGQGAIPDEVYDGWAEQIKFEDFNADEWVELAVQGGFKYIVVITKHHDGFHMWDTAFSDYKITNAPMGRDYIGELVAACHKRDMPIGFYYSQRDWHHPDYEPIAESVAERAKGAPYFKLKEGCLQRPGDNHGKYIEYMHNTVLELMEKYGKIDILWWDASWYLGMYTEEMWRSFELEKKVREKQPHILINNRSGNPGDFDTPECRIGHVQRDRAWETCMPMGNEWAWTGNGLKPFKKIMEQFVHTVCGDGNYLLSIGCMPNGRIAPEETACILRLGAFMKEYGHTVYNTRSGPWNPGVYGGSVYRGNTAYVHIVNKPDGEALCLPLEGNRVRSVKCLTHEGVNAEVQSDRILIRVPDGELLDMIFAVEMEDDVQVTTKGIDVGETDCATQKSDYSPFALNK